MFHHRTHTSSQSSRQLQLPSSSLLQSLQQSQSFEIIRDDKLKKQLIEIEFFLKFKTSIVTDIEPIYEEVLPRCPDFVKQQALHVQRDRCSRLVPHLEHLVVAPVGSSPETKPALPPKKKISTKSSTTPSSTKPPPPALSQPEERLHNSSSHKTEPGLL